MARRKERDQSSEVFKGRGFHMEYKTPAQKLAHKIYLEHDIIFLIGPAGTGKSFLATAFAVQEVLAKTKKKIVLTRPIVDAGEKLGFLPGPQPLDAKILTPDGWTTMGEINIGDLVIGRDGKPTKVLKIFPKGKKMVYKVSTTDGRSTECCEDHLWLTTTAENRKRKCEGSIKSTKQMMETLFTNKGKINHHIPRNEAVEFNDKKLPISPYLLGVILGDGSAIDSVSIGNMDLELVGKTNEELHGLGCCLSKQNSSINYHAKANLESNKPSYRVLLTNIADGTQKEYFSAKTLSNETGLKIHTIRRRCRNKLTKDGVKYEFCPPKNRWTNPIKAALQDLGLLGLKAKDKFIPEIYKFCSIKNRVELLRGLMDTDGTVKKNGESSFTTTSRQLAEDVIEIVRSLGGRAILRARDRVGKTSTHKKRNIICRNTTYEFVVSLPKTINPFYISRKASRFSQKYIHGVGIKSIEPVCEKEVQCILIENQEHLYLTDQYIVTHNTFDEKVHPYMLPLYDCIEKLCGPSESSRHRQLINVSTEIAPLAFMRGRTLDNAVCILDEAQNATYSQLKLFLTRMGEGSKMILTGDPTQSDLPSKDTCLSSVVSKLSSVPGIGVIQFKEEAIVRHPLVKEIVRRMD